MKSGATIAVGILLTIFAFGSAMRHTASLPPPATFLVSPPTNNGPALEGLVPETRSASSGAAASVHSATAVETSDGKILAVWYGGSREGAKDVALYSAVFDPRSEAWSDEARVTTREETASDLGRYVKKLGNPVVARDARGRLWLFYVSVSVGGWSGSSLNFRLSEDDGKTWGRARRLVTSPFLNLSTLVRGPAISFADGTLGLPVYHELLGKFGELLRLSPEGKILSKTRLSHGYSSLQPVVVPFSPRDAVVFMRRSGFSPPRILMTETMNGGVGWSDLAPTSLPNPDSALSALRLEDGGLLLAFNDSEVDRSRLVLAESHDRGKNFNRLYEVASPQDVGGSEPRDFAYPWLLQTSNGDVHLLYTWNRRRIMHVRFRPETGP